MGAQIGRCGTASGTLAESKLGGMSGPKHWCVHRHTTVYGVICAVKHAETTCLKRQGIKISVTRLQPKGQAKMNETNNNRCLLCHDYLDKLNKLVVLGASLNKSDALGA